VGGRTGGVGRARRAWPGAPDAELQVVASTWTGPEDGAGHLRERRLTVQAGGRRALHRPRTLDLLLPDRSGAPAPVPEHAQQPRGAPAAVTPLRRVG
jgi:hypothetical protein